jgi:hypothetical protein
MKKMKWKTLLIGGAFIGTFTLGALFSPNGESEATTRGSQNLPIIETATETDSVQERTPLPTCPMTGQPMASGARMGHYFSGTMTTIIAETLGITVEELQVARIEGKSVAQLAEEKNISVDDIKIKLIQARTAELEQLVSDGALTQAQMDAMIANLAPMIDATIKNNNLNLGQMNGHGDMGMMGLGGRGHMNGENQNLY